VKPWDVMITPEGEKMLLSIQDRRIRKLLKSRAMRLSTAPEKQGKPLKGELVGLRSVRAVGQRYRIIYKLDNESRRVWILAMGIRRSGHKGDIYEISKKATHTPGTT
jgi:mRNA interferase RelE/StbE